MIWSDKWLGVVLAGALAVACGSDDSSEGSGGAGGSGGSGASDAGSSGGSGGSGGTMQSGGAGGTAGSGGTAGAGGAAGTGGTAGTTGAPLVGVYVGNDPAAVTAFESWLGADVNGVLGYTGAASWADYDGSVGWAANLWKPIDRPVFWSVPLIPTGATLADAAQGTYDSHYTQAAQKLKDFRPQDAELMIRTGWEFNGDWFPWAAEGKENDFIGAFRHFVDAFRAVSPRFKFEWNVNMGNQNPNQMNPESAYPGDAYVDIIGMDFYWNTQWDPKDPTAAWNSMRDRSYGLKWHQDFAQAHNKRTSYSEWGVMSDAAGPYIEQAKLWFESHQVVFHTYWDSNSDFQGKLSGGQYPMAAAAYKAAFGVP